MIIKENYDPTGETLGAVTVMYKTEKTDWFWLKYGADGTVLAEGKPKGCVACHAAVKGQDWGFSTTVK